MVVVVKGPTQSILLREKQKIAGIWINAASMRFRSAPSFYAIASPAPIGKLVDARTRAIYELGLERLQQIGRASCRERVRQYVSISVVAATLKKKIHVTQI